MRKFMCCFIAFIMFSMTGCTEPATEKQYNVTNEEKIIETVQEISLSSKCDMILAVGDGYELVANQTDTYEKSIVEIGVIKDNEWLVPLDTSSPFVTDNGVWRLNIYDHFKDNGYRYVGDGCFIGFENPVLLEDNSIKVNSVVYCAETNVGFYNCDFGIYQTFGGAYMGNTPIISFDYNNVLHEREFVAVGENGCLRLYDLSTGNSKNIDGFSLDKLPDEVGAYSEGVFYARSDSYRGFFDKNGKMVIDLNQYNISYMENTAFKNNEITFKCKNPNGIEFNLTIDKNGKVVKEEKINN